MTSCAWRSSVCGALALTFLIGCKAGQNAAPRDPMLDALRAEQRAGNLSYPESQGKILFAHYCATCHGDDGNGDGQNASNLNPPPPDLSVSKNTQDQALLRRVITEGSAAVGQSPQSPPWGRSLSLQQIAYLVSYCQSIGRKKP
jgi:mono/diheme cytochrome c family protein